MENPLTPQHWTFGQKLAFRFIFCLFTLIIVIYYPAFPVSESVMKYPVKWITEITAWFGKHILHISYDITLNDGDSGDTTLDYTLLLIIFLVSTAGTILWSILDRKRENYSTLYYWLTTAVRFYVALVLIHYGLIKVIKAQFPYPDLYDLTEKLGNFYPERSAWLFFGHSYGYNLFMGMGELAAIFLLFRRTMIFGTIITLIVTLNVVMVNYFYDVPVKLHSLKLFIMTLFLLLTSCGQLWKFFFTGKAVALPVIQAPEIKRKGLRVGKIFFKILIISYALIHETVGSVDRAKHRGDLYPKSNLYGLYRVDTFRINSQVIPPLTTDTIRWKQLIMDWEGISAVRYMVEDSVRWFDTKLDTISKTIQFALWQDTTKKYSFRYTQPRNGKLNLMGVIQKDTVSIFMTAMKTKFKLNSRDFRWIIDYQSFY
jgi:hypothetical protein